MRISTSEKVVLGVLAGGVLVTLVLVSPWMSSPAAPTSDGVSLERAGSVLRQMSADPRLPNRTAEYGCADRAELVIAALLREGIPPAAVGRVSLLGPDLSAEFLAEADAALERGDAADVLAGRAGSVPDPWVARLLPQLRAPSLDISDGSIVAGENGTLRVGPYTLHPAPRAVWSVGHIAAYVMVPVAESTEPRVLDPALSPERLLTFDAWKALQSLPEGVLVASSLTEEKPALVVTSLTGAQRQRVAELLGVKPTVDAITAQLSGLDGRGRADFYNQLFGFEADSALRYEKWAGYTIAGGPTSADGAPLPRWHGLDPAEPGFSAREQRAVEQLAPLVRFEAFLSRLEKTTERPEPRATATTSEQSSSSEETREPASQR